MGTDFPRYVGESGATEAEPQVMSSDADLDDFGYNARKGPHNLAMVIEKTLLTGWG